MGSPSEEETGVTVVLMSWLNGPVTCTRVAAEETAKGESKWIAQKYVERPLLVHGRKFDLRQWVLVTCWSPLTVWFYSSCYVRFAADDFDITQLGIYQHLVRDTATRICAVLCARTHCSRTVALQAVVLDQRLVGLLLLGCALHHHWCIWCATLRHMPGTADVQPGCVLGALCAVPYGLLLSADNNLI